ncbi:MAG: phytoene desaturase family protein [Promethearchaeota archaeon]
MAQINNSKEEYDVIIIGSGMGGLSAGNALIKKGYSVLILEKYVILGGYCTNFQRNKYRFDSSLHILNGCGKNGMIYNVLTKIGIDVEKEFEFIKLKHLFRWRSPNQNIDEPIPANIKDYQEKICQLFPDEADNIRRFFKDYLKVVKFMVTWNAKKGVSKFILWVRYFRTFIRFMKSLKQSVLDIIKPYIKNETCINIMTAIADFFGLSIDELSATLFLAANFSYLSQGAYYIMGGSGYFSEKMADIFKNCGGKLLLGYNVKRVAMDNGLITSVIAEDEKKQTHTFKAKAIIVNSDPTKFVSEIAVKNESEDGKSGDKKKYLFPQDYVNKVLHREPGYSAVVAYFGVNLDLKSKGIEDYEIWGEYPNTGDNAENSPIIDKNTFNEIADSLEYDKISKFSVTIYSNIDPTCAPPGKSVVTSILYASPRLFKEAMEKDGGKRGDNYKKLKEKLASFFIKRISKFLEIPDFDKYIEVTEIATPITMERYTENRNGSTIGWKMIPEQMFLKQLSPITPIKNVFLAGAWTLYGGGFHP